MRKPKEPPRFVLTALFALIVFVILLITMFIVGTVTYFLERAGALGAPSVLSFLFMIGIASIAVGTVVSLFAAAIPVKPIKQLLYGLNSLAAGDYQTRLSVDAPGIGREVSESFNLLAEELQNTELLRSDFVNNFSHEFKTPLVSIRGFAKLLLRGGVPEEKQREYLEIISSESARLSDMATKVLDLAKLENQGILTDVSTYNLSEQLRECILLLERKWTAKNLGVSTDFSEIFVSANKEMLKQVWINLLDNAVKFTPEGGSIKIGIRKENDGISVSVANSGTTIEAEDLSRIFRKFYQADASHAAQGNGIGLAIVKRIVTLHEGGVWAECADGWTVFRVTLP